MWYDSNSHGAPCSLSGKNTEIVYWWKKLLIAFSCQTHSKRVSRFSTLLSHRRHKVTIEAIWQAADQCRL
uniref:Uncharacterized protein n=1 Tax=Knipowitschia caucasica TaxID=637954 RepID=A0AAV2MKG6_KNICA